MGNMTRLLGTAAAATLGLGLVATPAHADYPERAIEMVIPYGAGGATDVAARAFASIAPDYIDATLQVANRTGAGGATGSAYARNADPDGYTLLFARVGSHTVSPAMKADMPYEYDDFDYLGVMEVNPVICAVNPDEPYESMEELAAAVDENPGTITFSSSGVGTMLHLAGFLALDAFGVEDPVGNAIHVPFDGGGNAASAVVTGQITFVCTNSSALMGHIRSGNLRPLVVTTPEPLDDVDAPTARELGHPELESLVGWTALVGPPGLSDEARDYWLENLPRITSSDEWQESTSDLGSIAMTMDPDESLTFVTEQYEIFSDLVDRLGLHVE